MYIQGRTVSSSPVSASSQDGEETGCSHSTADAHADHNLLGSSPLALEQDVTDLTRACHAEGMADGNGASVDVALVERDFESIHVIQGHNSKGLVHFPQVNVFHFQSMTLKETGHCDRGADTHLFGRAPGNGKSIEPAQRLESSLLHLLLLHQHTSTRTIRQLAGVASSDRSLGILVDIHWLEFGKAVQRRVRAIAFIFGHNVFLLAHLINKSIVSHIDKLSVTRLTSLCQSPCL
mmetsp:Transcript_23987/g.78023  ORF Transcript_23987/g.78023 Transcript_23987/m.78023 type:complete len:235 (+) Transcript_23987:771-1475(+)